MMKIHKYQQKILKKLMYNPKLRFTDLHDKSITSEHFTYHLHKLVENGLITKQGKKYLLTNLGKDYVGMLNDKSYEVEKNPKVSVLVYIQRINKDGTIEFLMQKRLKQPYYGKVGNVTGKVQFGETFTEAARRELKEELGLEADLEFKHIYHKVRIDEKGHTVQDNVFAVFMATNPRGKLKKSSDAEPFWTTRKSLYKRKDLFDDMLDNLEKVLESKYRFVESVQKVEGY